MRQIIEKYNSAPDNEKIKMSYVLVYLSKRGTNLLTLCFDGGLSYYNHHSHTTG